MKYKGSRLKACFLVPETNICPSLFVPNIPFSIPGLPSSYLSAQGQGDQWMWSYRPACLHKCQQLMWASSVVLETVTKELPSSRSGLPQIIISANTLRGRRQPVLTRGWGGVGHVCWTKSHTMWCASCSLLWWNHCGAGPCFRNWYSDEPVCSGRWRSRTKTRGGHLLPLTWPISFKRTSNSMSVAVAGWTSWSPAPVNGLIWNRIFVDVMQLRWISRVGLLFLRRKSKVGKKNRGSAGGHEMVELEAMVCICKPILQVWG